jgi:N-acetyl-alpha-D-glucosaminyl L-malate synthase BshA
LKICIVTTMFPKYKGDYYGSFVFDEAKELVEKGFEIHVVTQHNTGIPYEEVMDGIQIHRFPWLEPKKFRAIVHFKGLKDNLRLLTYIISLFFNLIRIIRKYKIDVIHAHSAIPTGLVGVIVAKLTRLNSFITAHGMDINNFEVNSIYGRLISFSLNSCNVAIAVSEDLAKKMREYGVGQNKIVILKNAVDNKLFKPMRNEKLRNDYGIKEDEVLILFVGYLDIFKGIFEIIDAFCELHRHNKNLKLMMVGTGPKKTELKRKISKMGLENEVILTGALLHDQVVYYYQAADLFVLPSYTEGLPLSLLEAMACGLPVVASNVGGIPGVVEDGVNGYLVPSKDKGLLIQKLAILTSEEELRSKFGKKSSEIIEYEFNIKIKVDKLAELYKSLNTGHKGG